MRICNGLDQEPRNSKPACLVSSISRLLISTVLSSLFVGGAVVTTAMAQQAKIEEIVVTAQRREQNLQDISISISVLTSEQLENLRVEQPADLATYTPGMYVSTGIAGNPIFSLRGIGMNNNESNQNPAV